MAEKETYRLTVLLELREKKKEEAERYLGECLQALKKEADRLAEMEAELKRMITKREGKQREYSEKVMRGEMSAQEAISANKYVERMKEQEDLKKEEIQGQKKVVAQREQDVEGARADLIKANQDLKALEKHREKWQAQVRKEAATKEEEMLEEIAQTIFLTQDERK